MGREFMFSIVPSYKEFLSVRWCVSKATLIICISYTLEKITATSLLMAVYRFI